jgi:hypothetical protein
MFVTDNIIYQFSFSINPKNWGFLSRPARPGENHSTGGTEQNLLSFIRPGDQLLKSLSTAAGAHNLITRLNIASNRVFGNR